jgi:hypothetical protein
MGRYRFVNNKVHGFAHVKVSEHEYTVKIFGINQATQESTELYKVTVINGEATVTDQKSPVFL